MEREDEERRLRREMRRIKRKKEERIRQLILAGLFTAASVIILAAVVVLFKNLFQKKQVDPGEVQVPEYVKVDLLTPNPYSRPQKPLEEVRGIVVHYVANPCSTARKGRTAHTSENMRFRRFPYAKAVLNESSHK